MCLDLSLDPRGWMIDILGPGDWSEETRTEDKRFTPIITDEVSWRYTRFTLYHRFLDLDRDRVSSIDCVRRHQ